MSWRSTEAATDADADAVEERDALAPLTKGDVPEGFDLSLPSNASLWLDIGALRAQKVRASAGACEGAGLLGGVTAVHLSETSDSRFFRTGAQIKAELSLRKISKKIATMQVRLALSVRLGLG